MIHLILVLITCSCLTPRVPVVPIPRAAVRSLGVAELMAKPASPSVNLFQESEGQASPSGFIVTEATQVWLSDCPISGVTPPLGSETRHPRRGAPVDSA
jgi:hypothetical protein